MNRPLSLRKKYAATLPGVTRLPLHLPNPKCEGINWNKVPLKAVWHPKTHQRQPIEEILKYRTCKFPAQFRYNHAAKSTYHGSVFCFRHLITNGIFSSREDEARYREYSDAHADKFFSDHGYPPVKIDEET